MNQKTIIWLDLDGVHVDLDKHLLDRYTFKFPTERSPRGKEIVDTMWKHIADNDPTFWVYAPKTEYFDELFGAVKSTGHELRVLSATPASYDTVDHMNCALQKKIWAMNNMGFDIGQIYITKSVLKHTYIKEDGCRHILIDDHKSNIDRWNAAGGIGIIHDPISYEKTIDALSEALK